MDPGTLLEQVAQVGAGSGSPMPGVGHLVISAMAGFVAAAAAVLFLGHRMRRTAILERPIPLPEADGEFTMAFYGRKLWSASEAAQAFLDRLPDAPDAWLRLSRGLGERDAGISASLEALATDGTPFSILFAGPGGTTMRLVGRPRGEFIALRVLDAHAEETRRIDLERELDVAKRDNEILHAVNNSAPLLAWRRSADGTVLWCNELTREMTGLSDDSPLLPESLLTDLDKGPASPRRVAYKGSGESAPVWLEVLEIAQQDGAVIGHASKIDGLVRTENALQRFVSTLTETFAQLPVGLAIFDRDRKLNLFNPALIDLLGFDPARLARHPTLREFLDTLRDNRMVPGQKTFDDWRNYVTDIGEQAEAGTLREKLVLPTGRTFEISGRPHPHGAIALIFEDISPMATLERRYRTEIELSQATLDRLSEAVVVFDTSGTLVFANLAFTQLWGFDPMEDLEPIRIVEATGRWLRKTLPTPVWGDLRDFATRSEDRAQWDAEVTMLDGRHIHAGFSPLPDGSTLAVFSETGARSEIEEGQQAAGSDLLPVLSMAFDRMREAVGQISEDLRDGQLTDPKAAGRSMAGLLAQVEQIMAHERVPKLATADTMGTMIIELGNLAESRGLELDISMDEPLAHHAVGEDLRRLLFNMVMAGAEILKTGSMAQLSAVMVDDALALSLIGVAEIQADAPDAENALPMRLLERIAVRLDGTLNVTRVDSGRSLRMTCTIPHVGTVRRHEEAADKASA